MRFIETDSSMNDDLGPSIVIRICVSLLSNGDSHTEFELTKLSVMVH